MAAPGSQDLDRGGFGQIEHRPALPTDPATQAQRLAGQAGRVDTGGLEQMPRRPVDPGGGIAAEIEPDYAMADFDTADPSFDDDEAAALMLEPVGCPDGIERRLPNSEMAAPRLGLAPEQGRPTARLPAARLGRRPASSRAPSNHTPSSRKSWAINRP
ncbi:MAG: hypothetical protein WDN69_33920 [Aliidongia sp.]